METLLEHEVLRVSYVFLPLLGGGIVHGLFIRQDWWPSLKRPIDLNRRIRERRVFGDHKTFRGFVAFSLGTTAVVVLQAEVLHAVPAVRHLEAFDYQEVNAWALGVLVGIAAMLSELPNSFLKRQMDVRPGATGDGFWWGFFFVVDQIDLLVGAWFVFSLVTEVTVERLAISLVLVFLAHNVVNVIGYALGMRHTLR